MADLIHLIRLALIVASVNLAALLVAARWTRRPRDPRRCIRLLVGLTGGALAVQLAIQVFLNAPFGRALAAGDLALADRLYGWGADVDTCDWADRRGGTPLVNAVDRGDHDAAMFLLDRGADPIRETIWTLPSTGVVRVSAVSMVDPNDPAMVDLLRDAIERGPGKPNPLRHSGADQNPSMAPLVLGSEGGRGSESP
jgi:hypothetical protein